MNNSTVERKENVCRERRLLFGDQKSFPRTGFQAFWKFQLRVPSKRKQGPMHHPNLMYFGRNSSSSKVVDFYQETSRKADKTNPSKRGNEELCWKRHVWDALPLLVSRNLWVWPGVPGHTELVLLLPKATMRSKRTEKRGKKYTWLHYLQLFTATKRAWTLIRFQNLLGMCERRMNQSRKAWRVLSFFQQRWTTQVVFSTPTGKHWSFVLIIKLCRISSKSHILLLTRNHLGKSFLLL